MAKKIIAVTFSDLHIELWAKFNSDKQRTLNHFRVLSIIRDVCIKHKVPALFCGDLFHKSENIDNDLMRLVKEEFNKLHGNWECLAISGNHDLKYSNSLENKSPSWVKNFDGGWLFCIDNKSVKLNSNIKVHGLPYIDKNIGLDKAISQIIADKSNKQYRNILLLHTDYPGAEDTDGRRIDSVENINMNLLNKFDLVLCGHIHKSQRLGKKVYMVGAPLQQRRTDRDADMGYWLIYEDLTMKFISLSDRFPKFIDIEKEEDRVEDGNYYTIIPKKLVTQELVTNKINKSLSKTKLARRYCREKQVEDRDKTKLLIKLLKEAEDD